MKDLALAVLLLAAGVCMTVGLALVAAPFAWFGGGGLLAVWSWLVLADVEAAE